jgi:hypothetical protein
MDKRIFIRFDDDKAPEEITRIAQALTQQGLAVSDISPIVGQITGTVEAGRLASLQRLLQLSGGRLVLEDDDLEHRLPPERGQPS